MTTTFNTPDNTFAVSSGSNLYVTPDTSYFDYPPNSTANLVITSNLGDDNDYRFDLGDTYDLSWTGHGGGVIEDAVIIRSDYIGPGEGAVVFSGTNSITGEPAQIIWTPDFDVESWYWDNGGGPSTPNAFYTVDQNAAETYQKAVCFASDTQIDTPNGARAVMTLRPGDLVNTLDHGAVPIRWIHQAGQPLETAQPDETPVLIAAGALGANRPAHDLIVSPQHRVLLGGQGQGAALFETEIFAPAKALTARRGIRHMRGKKTITWVHFACAHHEIVLANGCWAESLLLGPMMVDMLSDDQRKTLTDIFGPAPHPGAPLNGPAARDCLTVGEVRQQLGGGHKQGTLNPTTQPPNQRSCPSYSAMVY